jgi:hypothetical protein
MQHSLERRLAGLARCCLGALITVPFIQIILGDFSSFGDGLKVFAVIAPLYCGAWWFSDSQGPELTGGVAAVLIFLAFGLGLAWVFAKLVALIWSESDPWVLYSIGGMLTLMAAHAIFQKIRLHPKR